MELGLSLGDKTSKASNGFLAKARDGMTTTTTTTTAVAVVSAAVSGGNSLGFCMALGVNPSNGTTHQADDEYSDDEYTSEDQETSKENTRINGELIENKQKISPVQLDLLPSVPVLRHALLPWSSADNRSSEGGSSGNTPAGRRLDVNRMPTAAGTEEATSSFRLDFGSFSRNRNHKKDTEMGNDAVEVERLGCCDDLDENRKKLRLSKEQSAYLEESFKENNTLNPKQKLALAKQLHLRPRQVEVWFQNRRARTKLKQTEVDCEYLKKCCETLTEENKKLHRELQELRALKATSNPFYMQPPATTLTMCPSCERVATADHPPPPSTTASSTVQPGSGSPRSLYPFSHAPPSNNSGHQLAGPS